MNNENDKKWFIYVNDHHEGPFTVTEVNEKKKIGLVTDQSYVWCEGMNDWNMLTEVKELSQELKKLEPQIAKVQNTSPAKTSTNIQSLKKATLDAVNSPKSGTQKKKEAVDAKQNQAPQPKLDDAFLAAEETRHSKKLPLILLGGLVGALGLGFGALVILSRLAPEDMHARLRPTFNKLSESVPGIGQALHLVPTLTDVTAEEQKDLELARSGAPDAGVKIALALSQLDTNRPAFYISTNLPDKTKFDVYLVGKSETLLNKLSFKAQNTVTTTHGFGKSEVFVGDGGQLIPKGEYQVVVVDANDQTENLKAEFANLPPMKPGTELPSVVPPNAHFVLDKIYFLGGPRDETYLTRLKQFHEKIKQNSDRELMELKQYSDTLNLQFSTLTTEFTRIYQSKKPSPQLLAAWKKDAATWQQINGQLEQTVQTWSKETIQNEFFYGKIYTLVKGTYDSIKSLFTLENSYVEHPVDHGTFDIQHGKALSETRDALELLRTKMDVILKIPKSASGLPTREGL